MRGERHDRDDPESQAREGQDDELPAVRQLHQNPVAATEPEAREPLRRAVGPGDELAVGAAHLAVDEGDRLRRRIRALDEPRAQGPAPPVPAGDVAADELVGPGGEALSDRPRHVRLHRRW